MESLTSKEAIKKEMHRLIDDAKTYGALLRNALDGISLMERRLHELEQEARIGGEQK